MTEFDIFNNKNRSIKLGNHKEIFCFYFFNVFLCGGWLQANSIECYFNHGISFSSNSDF